MFSPASELLDDVRAYRPFDERERTMRDRLVAFLEAHGSRAFDRALPPGHVTASAWIVDPERTQAVLLHHRKLERWLQLGGHVDGDPDVRRAALREAREESGLRTLRLIAEPVYDIDVHRIPARGIEPEHDHYDLRFALEADPREPLRAQRGVARRALDRAHRSGIVRDRRLGAAPRGKDARTSEIVSAGVAARTKRSRTAALRLVVRRQRDDDRVVAFAVERAQRGVEACAPPPRGSSGSVSSATCPPLARSSAAAAAARASSSATTSAARGA